jgi:hypothetical protein
VLCAPEQLRRRAGLSKFSESRRQPVERFEPIEAGRGAIDRVKKLGVVGGVRRVDLDAIGTRRVVARAQAGHRRGNAGAEFEERGAINDHDAGGGGLPFDERESEKVDFHELVDAGAE